MIVRRSTYDRDVQRLENELEVVRAEYDSQRSKLLRDLRDVFAQDIEGRVKGEVRREARHASKIEKTLRNLISFNRQLLRLDYHDPSAPAMEPAQAEEQIKRLIRAFAEWEESEAQMI